MMNLQDKLTTFFNKLMAGRKKNEMEVVGRQEREGKLYFKRHLRDIIMKYTQYMHLIWILIQTNQL